MSSAITLTDKVTWGKVYPVVIKLRDDQGDPVVFDNTWQVDVRIARGAVGGELLPPPTVTIANGEATCSFDTDSPGWAPGDYYYDARITFPDGTDEWSEIVHLKLKNRITPTTA